MLKWMMLALAAALPLSAAAAEHKHGAHVHGVAELEVASEGKQLNIMLESPADNLLGFEHAPKTPAEAAKLKQALQTLQAAAKLFALDAAAQCQAAPVRVTPPKFAKGGHSEFAAEYQFRCAKLPATLGLPLWQQFPRLKQITANVAGASGQKQLGLKSGQALPLQ